MFIVPVIYCRLTISAACVRVVLSPQKMKPGRQVLEELELHTQYKNKYDVSDDQVDPAVERLLLTQNSIRKYMEDRGMGPEQRRAEREERRTRALAAIERGEVPEVKKPEKSSPKSPGDTHVKISNPLQQEFDIDDFDNSDDDTDDNVGPEN
eukprot:COSAG02_NODE_3250_length_7094_cov_10.309507_4_plen_152_part_00